MAALLFFERGYVVGVFYRLLVDNCCGFFVRGNVHLAFLGGTRTAFCRYLMISTLELFLNFDLHICAMIFSV